MRPQMIIRSYTPVDEAQVVALWHACELVAPHNNPQRDIERKLKVNPEWFLVSEDEGIIIGTVMVGYEGHRGWINYLAVAPGQQRTGRGRALMDAAEQVLRSAGCAKINLQVRTKNEAVIAFYRHLGFQLDDCVSLGKRLEAD